MNKKNCMPLLIISALLLFSNFGRAQYLSQEKAVIKILTFNILHGATTKGDFNLDVIADVIIRTKPDYVALQEVDFKTNRAKKYDLVTELAFRTGMIPLFGRAMNYDDGEYGEGILSKSTFIKTRNVPLPYLEGYEPRTALEITTITEWGDTISFVGTHFDHEDDDTNRVMQAEEINSVFSQNMYPTILSGDLNATPNSRPINILESVWTSTYNRDNPEPTFPSENPQSKIDYVMYIPYDSWRVIETKVIQDTIASDHCAYLVTLKLVKE